MSVPSAMPRLSIYIIRASLIYLLAGMTLGALLLTQKAVPLSPALWRLLPLHIEFVLMGWIVQLVVGVSFWMLPRLPGNVRQHEQLVWIGFICLNIGILLVGVEPFFPALSFLGLGGRLSELVAIVLYISHVWRRVRPFGDSI